MIDVWFLAGATAVGVILLVVKAARCVHQPGSPRADLPDE